MVTQGEEERNRNMVLDHNIIKQITTEEAIITLKLCSCNFLIMGIHLVACPMPQFKGDTRIFFFNFI